MSSFNFDDKYVYNITSHMESSQIIFFAIKPI